MRRIAILLSYLVALGWAVEESPVLLSRSGTAVALADCLQEVLAANRPFRTLRSQLERSRLQVSVNEAEVFSPRLKTAYTWSDSYDSGNARVGVAATAYGFDIEPYLRAGYGQRGLTGPPERDRYDHAAGIALSRRLFAIAEHLRKRLPVTQAERDLFLAANRVVLEGRSLELRATRAFLDIQRSDLRQGVRERRLTDAHDTLAAVQDQVEKGFKAPLDLVNARIAVNQARIDVISEQAIAADVRETLNRLLGRAVEADLVIQPVPVDATRAALVADPPLDRDLDRVLEGHEELGNRARELDVLLEQVRIARDNVRPDVTAGLNAERVWSGDQPGQGGEGVDDRIAFTATWTMPLDDWKAERARLGQAERLTVEKRSEIKETQADLTRRLRSAARSIATTRTNAALAVERVEAERARLAATLRRWEAGQVDNLEVNRSKRDVDLTEIALMEARLNLLVAEAEYRSLLPARLELPRE